MNGTKSPPSRGAWIEIIVFALDVEIAESPPSRGAWIEIIADRPVDDDDRVAPLAGGVD